jgi:hypothetical protein
MPVYSYCIHSVNIYHTIVIQIWLDFIPQRIFAYKLFSLKLLEKRLNIRNIDCIYVDESRRYLSYERKYALRGSASHGRPKNKHYVIDPG